MICLFPRQAIQHHSNPSLYTPTTNAKEAKVDEFCEALEDLLRLTPKKKKKSILCIIGDWNAKVESQDIPALENKMKQDKG